MANRSVPITIKIKQQTLRTYVKAEAGSFKALVKDGEYTDRAIRKALQSGEMYPNMVAYISHRLGISPYKFAYMNKYFRELEQFLCGGYQEYMYPIDQ